MICRAPFELPSFFYPYSPLSPRFLAPSPRDSFLRAYDRRSESNLYDKPFEISLDKYDALHYYICIVEYTVCKNVACSAGYVTS